MLEKSDRNLIQPVLNGNLESLYENTNYSVFAALFVHIEKKSEADLLSLLELCNAIPTCYVRDLCNKIEVISSLHHRPCCAVVA